MDLLAPQSMAPDEIADLVERTRAASDVARRRAAHLAGSAHKRGRPSLDRVAARYAALAGVSIAKAVADVSSVSGRRIAFSGVVYQWRRIYPGISTVLHRRGAL